MKRFLNIGMVIGVSLIPLSSISCSKQLDQEITIVFDASYDDISIELINNRLNLDKFQDKELLVIINNVDGENLVKSGYINKETITVPGNESLVTIVDWVEYIVRQIPSGSTDFVGGGSNG